MATKAELEAELAELRQKMEQKVSETVEAAARTDAPEAFAEMLSRHGIGSEEISQLWTKLSDELGPLTQNKTLMAAIGAFGLGFVLGRLSKT
ncbi:hypothetical protein QO034_05730 [Sedimentitalea sp. JM2-8]|uniref:Membrane-anchored ribosome-binding protein, inhibits growth in stationary phase, ElaB/YqjD/DUF883 family n=1 Tax=Sedimentitalea xiamensis TaxID=3050037 RepID=A0ABT7FC49_9RHOB|nr:hypothetical protein [Sedimentitalea xiamensis]MDK3072603.1 hypothetical protein [Sedimentitalea xiamensis]